ncbi:hypothetical protein ACQJBY_040976 [Aegilops geniculata]
MPPPAPAIQLGATPPPCLRTHGAKMARRHMYDWIVLLLLAAIEVVLNLITPFHRFVAEFMMDDLRYPMKPNTIPVWAVPIYAVILPMLIFAAIYVKKRNAYDLHHAILGRPAVLRAHHRRPHRRHQGRRRQASPQLLLSVLS